MSEVSINIQKNKGGRRKGNVYNKNAFQTKPIRVIADLIPAIRKLEADFICNKTRIKD